jgi:S-adenosylmethionine hydrolase
MKKRKLVIITDCVDVASNEIRANIQNFLKEEIDIEPIVPVYPFSLINASFILRLLADVYGPRTIFYIVVNPIKGQPERIAGKTKKKDIYFIGRNTGVFSWLIQDFGCEELYEIREKSFVPFGGKFIYPKYISKIINNEFKDESFLSMAYSKLRRIQLKRGMVIHIDNFGLLKIYEKLNLFKDMGLKEGDKVDIIVKGQNKSKAVYRKRMMDENDGKLVIYPGSSLGGLPEIGRVRMTDAPKKLKLKIGDIVEFKKSK